MSNTVSKPVTKAGFISLLGRTNSGKSSVVNHLLDERISLVSHKRNATRRSIKAIIMHANTQLILIDTPGLHESEKVFNKMLVENAQSSAKDCELVLFVTTAKDSIKDYEEFLKKNYNKPHIILLNKVDLISKEKLFKVLGQYQQYASSYLAILPYSTKKNNFKKPLLDELIKYMPEHEFYYPEDELSTSSSRDIARDIILEALFDTFSDEIPYSCDVILNDFEEGNSSYKIRAVIITDNTSHKAMLIGKEAGALKRLGIVARKKLQAFFGMKIALMLHVEVKKAWQKDERMLRKLEIARPSDEG